MTEETQRQQLLDELQADKINPMNDVLFKFVFGKEERKGITIDFLNAVLEESLEHPIRDIRFMQTEQVPQNDGGKLTRFDVACEMNSGGYQFPEHAAAHTLLLVTDVPDRHFQWRRL